MQVETCKDCSDRHPMCHDSCKKYQDALAEFRRVRDLCRQDRNNGATIVGLHINRVEKRKR